MKNFKKIVVVMAIFLSLVLFACGKKTSKENTTNKPTTDKIPTTTNKTTIDPNRKYSLNIKTNVDGCTVLTDKDEYSIGDTVTLTGIGNDQYDCVGFVALNSKSMDYSDVKYVFSYSDTFTFNLGDYGINAISLDLLDYTYAIFAPKNHVCVMSLKNTDAMIEQAYVSWAEIDSTIEIGQHIYTEGKAIDYVYDFYPVWKYNENITPLYIPFNYTFDNNETRLYVFDIVTKDATTYNLSIAPDSLDNGSVSYSTTSNISYNDITGNVRGIIEKDTEVTIYAVGKTRPFVGWYEYGTDNLVSNQSPYIFNMTSDVILTAKWDVEENNIAYLPEHFIYDNDYTITGINVENVKEIIIPSGVECIGYEAFKNITTLEKITFNSDIIECGPDVFTGCTNITDVYYDGTIKQYCSIEYSNGDGNPMCNGGNFYLLDSNGTTTYRNKKYTLVTDLILTDDITSIGYCCFRSFNGLNSIAIPTSVNTIDFAAFSGCDNLSKVYYEGTIEQWALIDIDDNSYIDDATIYYYSEEYKAGNYWHYVNYVPTIWEGSATTTYTLTTINDNPNAGSITSYTNEEFNAGTSVTLTATRVHGFIYVFDGWYNGGTLVSKNNPYTFEINSNLTLTAKWKLMFDTFADDPVGGTYTEYSDALFDLNDEIELTATTNTGYIFDGWYEWNHSGTCYGRVSEIPNFTYKITRPGCLEARWSIQSSTTYTLTTINDKTYAGSITSYTNEEFNAGSSVTLTATVDPESGYTFDGWYDGTTRKSTNEVYTFTINSNLTLTAKWTYYTVTTKPCYNSENDVPDSMNYYYIGGNFKVLDEEKVTVGETIQLIVAPNEESVTWLGWYKQSGNYTDGYTYSFLSNELSYSYEMTSENVVIVAKFLLYKVLATVSTTDTTPTIIEYGFYPQAVVDDDDVKSELESYVEDLPTEDDKKTWTSYGYYDDDVVSNYMWYKDIDIDDDGVKDYRGVYFTKYRGNSASSTAYSSDSAVNNNDIYKNGYRKETVYWFKFEPVIWDVVDDAGANDKRIVSRYAIDAQHWHTSSADRPDGLNTIYANNYKESSIKEWLNNDFYYTVFDIYRQKNNVLNLTDNSLESTGKTTTNNYLCNDTVDKVYLLSVKEYNSYLKNKSYAPVRPTDYAQIQGADVQASGSNAGYSVYWLRTPNTTKTSAIHITSSGSSTGQESVLNVRSIRPAMDMML